MSNLYKIVLIVGVIPKLGFFNVLYAIYYKLSLKFGLLKSKFPIIKFKAESYFKPCAEGIKNYPEDWKVQAIDKANCIIEGKFTWFSYHTFKIGTIPNWFYNPFTNSEHPETKKHWTEIKDFDERIGDIKIIWEQSRFGWLLDLMKAYRVTGESLYFERANNLINDWIEKNPVNQGPNWKCGQEASFRVMRLLTAAQIMNQFHEPTTSLQNLVRLHLERVHDNITYAIIQDNNHGTSEAAALYIGATWLEHSGAHDKKTAHWKKRGRKVLKERILTLIQPDGTFAQRSCNYHRVVVDTMSFVLSSMRFLKEESFSEEILERLESLALWQYRMIFGLGGEMPNFGSNDGALIEVLHNCDYQDFRPSIQLLYALLKGKRLFNDILVSEVLYWRYGINEYKLPEADLSFQSYDILDDQILIMSIQDVQLFMKLPEDTFRPGNDAFHIDLWVDGKNILRDNGTYSYNDDALTDEFKSIASHNTIQFSDHEQMPKISRFLYGKWLKLKEGKWKFLKSNNEIAWQGSYVDYKGNLHERQIELSNSQLIVTDHVNSDENATIRFHILNENNPFTLTIESEKEVSYKTSYFSRYYLEKTEHPMVEIEMPKSTVQTVIKWK